jgi:hypothetical protein
MELFEELVACFGLGMEGWGVSQDVIDSYPAKVVVQGGTGEGLRTSLSYGADEGGSCNDERDGIPKG